MTESAQGKPGASHWLNRLTLGACTAAALAQQPAQAHHTVSSVRVGESLASGLGLPGQRPGAQLRLALHHQVKSFSSQRALGPDALQLTRNPELGDARVHLSTLHAQLETSRATRLELAQPLGALRTRSGDLPAQERTSMGLGDTWVRVSQGFLFGRSGLSAPSGSLRVYLGGVLPTGHYAPEQSLSGTAFRTGAGGSLDSITYDNRLSLGAGTWAATLGVSTRWPLSEWLCATASAHLLQPLSRTPDGNRWGSDLATRLGMEAQLSRSVGLGLGLGGQRHHADRSPTTEAEARRAVTSGQTRAGGRDQVVVTLSATFDLTEQLACRATGGVPIWRQVGGIQLVERLGTSLGCGLGWAL